MWNELVADTENHDNEKRKMPPILSHKHYGAASAFNPLPLRLAA
jgi:hypothetical protein